MIRIPDNVLARMNVLIGSATHISDRPVEIFSDARIAFLSELSRRLLVAPNVKALPDVVTFAYWCRLANLRRIRESYGMDERLRMGLGLTFHICPSNVPVNFAFSMAFGLLSGNSCVLRLPSRSSVTVDLLVDTIGSLLVESNNLDVRHNLMLVNFDRDDEVVRFWMSLADGRIVWGGDETVRRMRLLPSKPRSREVAFSDRYSLCVLNPQSIIQMPEPTFRRFCKDMFNDIYLMDQSACSSPQLVAWIGEPDNVRCAQLRLWPAVEDIAEQQYRLQAVHVIDKFVQACRSALANHHVQKIERHKNLLYRLRLDSLDSQQEECRGFFGTIHEVVLHDLNDLASIVSERYQTLTLQGIDAAALRRWIITNRLRGIDRVVPVGRALDMNIVWDGYDMISSLSRLIDV